jgi:hypothetical protein
VENLFAGALYFGDTGEFEKKRNLTGEIHTPAL